MANIALLGFGNVGRALMRYLDKTGAGSEFKICAIADITGGLILPDAEDVRWILAEQGRSVAECGARGSFFNVPSYIDRLSDAGVSLLVECMPTNPHDGQPALDLLMRAILLGLDVVTVDKGPLVHGYQSLVSAAANRGTRLAYSGTTGVRPPAEIAGCHVTDIRGILNGTTNYILTEMQERLITFKDALDLAIRQGIAEPNPELDIQGWDTACKLLILANEWMHIGANIRDVARIGIGAETEELIVEARSAGRLVRLVGHAHLEEGRPRLTVSPMILGPHSPLHSITGASKGAVFATRERGEVFAAGVSGLDAIAQIILDDIKAIAAKRMANP